MRFLAIIAVLSLVVFSCGEESPSEQSVTKGKTSEKKIDGKKIYKRYCVTCHGVYGDMGANGAFNLTESKLTVAEKISVINNGRNTMTAFKGLLSDAKIKAVAEYTEKLKE
ncbi:MAG: cytochrome c [Bacteroidota bacterium]